MDQINKKNITIQEIPMIELNNDNIQYEWDNLKDSLNDCTFIAVDLEMTGLGIRGELNHPSIDERYKIIKKAASSYGIVSFGISCFKMSFPESENILSVRNRSFNLNLLCSDHFLVDPESIKFLIFNNHDIALNFSKGIKYYKGNDRNQDKLNRQYPRELFIQISHSKKPIIFHNGLIDIIFLYQNFYADTPENLMKFLADLREIFPNGIYDTKFISEFYGRYNTSHLEYLYYKSLYENSLMKKLKNKNYFEIEFDQNIYLEDFQLCDEIELSEQSICNQYYLHGHCTKLLDQECHRNHDLKKIFNFYIKKENTKTTKSFSCFTQKEKKENNCRVESTKMEIKHNAGIDAFMTGFVMIYLTGKISNFEYNGSLEMKKINLSSFKEMESFNYNINLSGKDFPLVIQKSKFNSISLQHREKKQKLEIK